MEEENYDKIISECTKEIESGGRYTAEALLLRATFFLLIGNATAAQPDLDRVINMQDANVKVRTADLINLLLDETSRPFSYYESCLVPLQGNKIQIYSLLTQKVLLNVQIILGIWTC